MAVKIVTQHICPPIPSFKFDWRATWDGYDLGDPVGYGATEQEAIDDLREILGLDGQQRAGPGRPWFVGQVSVRKCHTNI